MLYTLKYAVLYVNCISINWKNNNGEITDSEEI